MILVTGALGFIGVHLVKHLLSAGLPVRVLIPPQLVSRYERRGRDWPWAEAGEADVFTGSIFQGESLFQSMQGVHTVIHLASAQWWGSRQDLEQIDVLGTRQVAVAARTARVGRIITLSHLGAEPSSAYTLLRVKGQVEDIIKRSGVAYTIFRTGLVFGEDDHFVNNLAMLLRANPFFIFQPGQGENILQPLYIGDLIQAIENSLETVTLVDEVLEIGGGEYITLNELIRTVMRVSGARRMILTIPPYAQRALNGITNALFPRWPISRQWFDILASNRAAKLNNLYHYTGVHPVRFEDTLLQYMPYRRYRLELLRYIFRRRPGLRF